MDDLAVEGDPYHQDLAGSHLDDGGDVVVGPVLGDRGALAEELDPVVRAQLADDLDPAPGRAGGSAAGSWPTGCNPANSDTRSG